MKHSIVKIFKKLSLILSLNTLLVFIVAVFVYEQNFSYKKIENLDKQRAIINSLNQVPKEDTELAKIQIEGKKSLLLAKINQLKRLYRYDFVGQYIIFSKQEYLKDLNKLVKLTKRLKYDAETFNKQKLQSVITKINKQLDELYIKNVRYNQQKSFIISQLVNLLLLISLFIVLWYRKHIKIIMEDINFLSSIQPVKKYETQTLEADAILLRMRKKGNETIDPSLLDPVTDILNHRGLRTIYSLKKNMKEGHFTSLCVFEIDNFSKSDRKYPQELTQAILKKVAFTLTLFEQPTDIIARTDYNQFTVIIVRSSKEQCFKDIERIRQSINELKFKLPNEKYTNISISGGFVIKQNNKTLEDAINTAKEILQVAKERGGNMIAKISDLAKLDI